VAVAALIYRLVAPTYLPRPSTKEMIVNLGGKRTIHDLYPMEKYSVILLMVMSMMVGCIG
jgi:hypothetical protein